MIEDSPLRALPWRGATVSGACRHSSQTPYGLVAPYTDPTSHRSGTLFYSFSSATVSPWLMENSFGYGLTALARPALRQGRELRE